MHRLIPAMTVELVLDVFAGLFVGLALACLLMLLVLAMKAQR